jgi:hypothetical protein
VGLFRRKPLHQRLLEQGGLANPPSHEHAPFTGLVREAGIHGVARPRRWDTVVTVEAPGLAGRRAAFVAVPDGSLVVEDQEGDAPLDQLAAAVETELRPPYRAEAARHRDDLWAVSARRIEVAEFGAAGDELELAVHEGETVLRVDGNRVFGSEPSLERIGQSRGRSYVVRARRIDGDLWEVEAAPL